VVVTVIAAVVVLGVPLAVIVAGTNRQAASEGRPVQARLIVPLNPVELETLIEVAPDPPGAVIRTVDCADEIVPKKPGVIVNVWGWVVLLALKLASPLYEADMACVPVSKLNMPLGLAVFPWPFKGNVFPPGIAPNESLNVTVPVG
jgi:hypothetical protein